jgi:glutamate/tyrosine decarboxylase-like PLP-dependent enzyme
MEVVHWLRKQLGYEVPGSYATVREIGGVFTLGGCLSNTIALMAARETLFPGSSSKSLPFAACNIRVLVPEVIEYYSVRSAMSWLNPGK